VKINTREGRAIKSTKEEMERGVREVKSRISDWRRRLEENPERLHEIESEVRDTMCRVGDHLVAGMLKEVSGEEPPEQEIEAVREKAVQEGNPLKAPLRNYPIKVAMLSGLILCLRVLYCPPDKGKAQRMKAQGLVPEAHPQKGVHVELGKFGFGKGCSPALQEEVARLVVYYPSLELARKDLCRRGIVKDIKQIRRITLQLGFGMLDVRRQRIERWRSGELTAGTELAGKKVAVAIDGGRVRFRVKKKGKTTRFLPVWREPKMLIIYTMDENGRKESKSACWIDGTFQKADQLMELLAMHLHRLGAKYARSIEFVSDGAPWIWNRLDWVIEKVGVSENRVIKVLDFWHAAHHISIALEKMGMEEKERKEKYRKLRSDLRRGRWKDVVEELENCASEKNEKGAEGQHEATQAISYLRRHGEYGYLQYLRCKRHRITRGSGAIESTIRRVINLRMKGNGIFWREENAEAMMVMRANLLSDQWDAEIKAVRERWKTGGRDDYKWKAENILESVKREYFEENDVIKMSEISEVLSNVA